LLLSALIAIASTNTGGGLLQWLRHLGGPGLILLGIIDNSVVPVPGSMDVFTIVLSADQPEWWPYYAFMATMGSVVGGYFTFQLARGGGGGRLVKRLKRSQREKVHAVLEKWGFWAIAVPALLPPPLPMVPFVIAAGAGQYSLKKFIPALFVGRAVRYSVLAILAAHYGKQIFGYFSKHTGTIVWTAIALVAAGILVAVFRAKHSSARHA